MKEKACVDASEIGVIVNIGLSYLPDDIESVLMTVTLS
jgi:hypothetical protein